MTHQVLTEIAAYENKIGPFIMGRQNVHCQYDPDDPVCAQGFCSNCRQGIPEDPKDIFNDLEVFESLEEQRSL